MVLFRPTNIGYEVRIYQDMPVKDVITDVCRQANMYTQNDCYLWFDSRELDINDTIFQAGLYEAENLRKNLPEVRLKYVQMLQASSHISKHVFLTSPEKVAHNEILNIPLPSVKKHIIPNVLKEVAEQIAKHASLANQSSHQFDTVLIPLPNFSKQLIDSLPTIYIRVPLSPDQFDWNEFLECLAIDLEIDRTDLIIVTVRQGSSIFKIKLRPIITQIGEKVKKFTDKLLVLILPKCEKFIAERMPSNISEVKKIEIELKNFTERKITEDIGSVSPDEIDLALRLSERPAIINDISWSFLIEKSRQITTSIIQSIQSCSDEHTIDHASLIYNEKIYDKYERLNIDKSEKVLFHGTNTINFDGIFQNNFQCNSGAKATDKGWYGQGIYFSSSPEKALNYAKSGPTVSYLICSLVRLGKTLTVTDLRYKGKPMHQDYDSHYVPIRKDGDPVSQGEIPAFEEFVIKKNDQIIPLYIVGMLKVFCFVIWRDAKITNEANSSLFEQLKNRYAFNIYGIQTSTEALDILKLKLKNDSMKCVVVTNGADDGEGFVRQCRAVRPSLPIIVYCKNTTYHQQWAATLPTPKINVTSSPEYVFDYITNTLQK
jgi:hypothetical protein